MLFSVSGRDKSSLRPYLDRINFLGRRGALEVGWVVSWERIIRRAFQHIKHAGIIGSLQASYYLFNLVYGLRTVLPYYGMYERIVCIVLLGDLTYR